jgi:prolyl-tRNA editing enzyme YbaK/EbsC (Cys-tRNA(Pro) deacylase)
MGLGYRKIATKIGCLVGAVRAVVQKQHQTSTVVDKSITRRKQITT